MLEELLDDPDPLLRLDVARALSELGDGKSVAALRARLEVDNDARAKRRMREAVRDLSQDAKRAPAASRDDFDKLETEHAELKARLAALEARLTGETRASSSKAPAVSNASKKAVTKEGAREGASKPAKKASSSRKKKARQ